MHSKILKSLVKNKQHSVIIINCILLSYEFKASSNYYGKENYYGRSKFPSQSLKTWRVINDEIFLSINNTVKLQTILIKRYLQLSFHN